MVRHLCHSRQVHMVQDSQAFVKRYTHQHNRDCLIGSSLRIAVLDSFAKLIVCTESALTLRCELVEVEASS